MFIGQFWGTSAAEGIPAPFCRCPTCTEAREKGGRQIRLRSCFRLSDKIMLDLGADAVSQSVKYGAITEIDHVLVTHTHDDHLNPHMLMEAMWSAKQRNTLHYYFTDKAFEIVDHWRNNPWILKGKVKEWEALGFIAFHKLEYGIRTQIDDIWVTPFKGNHTGNVQENTALYLIELPDGRTLFYGLDSGPYLPETIEALKGYTIDLFISEGTIGMAPLTHNQHMSFSDVRQLVDTLLEQGTLKPTSTVYLTHINHHTLYNDIINGPAQLQYPLPTVVAYDGLKIL